MWNLLRQVSKSFGGIIQASRSGSHKAVLLWEKIYLWISRQNYARIWCEHKLTFVNTIATYHAEGN